MATQIPNIAHPIATATGTVTTPWYQFLWMLLQAVNSASGAPTTATYIVASANATLTNERVATDSASVDVDTSVPAQMLWHVIVDPAGALEDGPLAVRVDGVTVQINGSNELEAIAGASWVPLSAGTEPLTFISDGAGNPVLVAYP